jgi:hypothetical protein
MKDLLLACVLGLAIGVGLGPIVGAFVDASRSAPPTAPGAILATAATRLREFQYSVIKLRMGNLVDMVATGNVKSNPMP